MSESNATQLIVSIVVYNPDLPHLRETLKSVLASSLKIKVVIADNSKQALSATFLEEFKNVAYTLTGKNLGYGKGHNINIEKYATEAPYFLVLNPDVYFGPQLLGEMLRRMEADTRIGLSIPRICHPGGGLQMVNRRLPRPQDYVMNFVNNKLKKSFFTSTGYEKYLLKDIDLEKPFVCPTISGCFMFFRSDTLRKVGGFDKRYFLYLEDTDLSRRVAKTHMTVVFSDLMAFHHWSRGAYKNLKLFMLFVNNLGRYFNKWGWIRDQERDELNGKVDYYPVTQKAGTSVLKKPDLFDSL